MTHAEYKALQDILLKEPFQVRPRLAEFMKTVKVVEEKKYPTRTDPQRRAYFEWLEQIAQQCENMGVTAEMLFRHTMHIKVTKNILHESIKSLIKALWNLDSTNDLRKTGHLDEIQDHVASWVGKENIEIPPFPAQAPVIENTRLSQMENLEKENYPELVEMPKF